jgi:hypothetical protein
LNTQGRRRRWKTRRGYGLLVIDALLQQVSADLGRLRGEAEIEEESRRRGDYGVREQHEGDLDDRATRDQVIQVCVPIPGDRRA